MSEPTRREFFKGAAVATLGTAVSPAANAQTTQTPVDYEAFVRLSQILTGLKDAELPAMVEQNDTTGARKRLYVIYAERLQSAFPEEFGELLAFWRGIQDRPDAEALLAERLTAPGSAAQRLRLAARQVIKIWYLSALDDPRRPLDPQKKGRSDAQLGGDLGQYQHSAIWKLLGAPVPGYSNLPHGYWSKAPTS